MNRFHQKHQGNKLKMKNRISYLLIYVFLCIITTLKLKLTMVPIFYIVDYKI